MKIDVPWVFQLIIHQSKSLLPEMENICDNPSKKLD